MTGCCSKANSRKVFDAYTYMHVYTYVRTIDITQPSLKVSAMQLISFIRNFHRVLMSASSSTSSVLKHIFLQHASMPITAFLYRSIEYKIEFIYLNAALS